MKRVAGEKSQPKGGGGKGWRGGREPVDLKEPKTRVFREGGS